MVIFGQKTSTHSAGENICYFFKTTNADLYLEATEDGDAVPVYRKAIHNIVFVEVHHFTQHCC